MIPNLLTIAGSDPSGGAGIQADLKTFAALGGYGMSVITALTVQNTQEVRDVFYPPTDVVRAQLLAVFEDVRVDAVKIGMSGSAETIGVIADVLKSHAPRHVVVDPVMVSSSGNSLMPDDALEALIAQIFPQATLITPNIPEAQILLQRDRQFKTRPVLRKGGHADDVQLKDVQFKDAQSNEAQSVDILFVPSAQFVSAAMSSESNLLPCEEGSARREFSAPRIQTRNTHGTGCTLSAAIAVYLAKGLPLESAVESAKHYVTQALQHADALDVGGLHAPGAGHGPLHHGYASQHEAPIKKGALDG